MSGLSEQLRKVHGLHAFAELFGFDWTDGSDWTWHDVACAMADAVDAALGAGTCQADETETWECVCDGIGRYGKRMTIHVMECTECGHTYEHVNGDYEFCPRCGRRREDVTE